MLFLLQATTSLPPDSMILKIIPIVTGCAALFIPILIWQLNRSDRKDDLYTTDRYIKRLDLLKRLRELDHEHDFLDITEKHRHILSEEVTSILQFFTIRVEQQKNEDKGAHFQKLTRDSKIESPEILLPKDMDEQSAPNTKTGKTLKKINIKRFLLWYRPLSVAVASLQLIYWIFCGCILFLSLAVILSVTDGTVIKYPLVPVIFLFMMTVFVVLAKLLNNTANRFQDRKTIAKAVKG